MANQTLLEAAEYIKEHGWTQGNYRDDPYAAFPKVCAYGAIYMVTGIWTDAPRHVEANNAEACLRSYLLAKDPRLTIADWNDNIARNEEEVIQGMIEAAESCE